jgi:isopentenyl-diphosphate delta-isomerase
MKKTESRKKDHVELVLKKKAQYGKTTGFENIEFIHNALPEISLEEIDLSVDFLGKKLSYPIIITAMTGGYKDAKRINRDIAQAAQEHGLAFGVGSQRAMIEDPALAGTFRVRDVAPDIPLLANIGAFQLKRYSSEQIEALVSSIEADALAVHLNPLQEVVQPEGDTDFSGVLDAIRRTCDSLDAPVLVKETGAGITQTVAEELRDAGVAYLDVAGAGGTSWSKVEYLRSGPVPGFENWGIPTAECVILCRGVLPLIASGGIRDGVDAAKAIALGAELAGAAFPFLDAWRNKRLDEYIRTFKEQMRISAFLTGSKSHAQLRHTKLKFLRL